MDSGQSREAGWPGHHSCWSSHNWSLSVPLLTRSLFLVTCQESGKNQIVREACNMMTIVVVSNSAHFLFCNLHFLPFLEDRNIKHNRRKYWSRLEALPAASLLGKFYLVRPAEYNLEAGDRFNFHSRLLYSGANTHTANRAVNNISWNLTPSSCWK